MNAYRESRRLFRIALCVMWVACAAGCAAQAPTGGDSRWNIDPRRAKELFGRVEPGRDVTPPSWPGGKPIAVALTFDVDGEIVWGEPQDVSISAMSRGRYGIRAGLPRILDMLDRRNLPATFFFPAINVQFYPEALAAVQRSGRHEIGYHGYAHEDVATLSAQQQRDALQRGLAIFREAGIEPRVYRSASFNFSDATLGLLEASGFRYDSSLMADDRPYVLLRGGRATDVIELPVDWSLDDWPYFQIEWATPLPGLRDPAEVLEIWKAEFDAIRQRGGVFVLTLHPQVIGRPARLRMLEQLLDHIDTAGDAWCATLSRIGDYARQNATKVPP